MNLVSEMWGRAGLGEDEKGGRMGLQNISDDLKSSGSLSSLASVSTVLGALGKIAEGKRRADGLMSRAVDEKVSAFGAEAAGVEQQGQLKSQLLAALGANTAKAGQSGLDTGQGIVQDTNTALTKSNVSAQTRTGIQAGMRARSHRINALRLQMAAEDARRAGVLGAVGMVGNQLISAARMG